MIFYPKFPILMLKVLIWNIITFPKNTKYSQNKKFYEERDEWENSTEKTYYKELADMWIVAVGMIKFDMKKAIFMFKYINKFCLYDEDLKKAIKEKMAINKKRKWKFKKGVYHHY